MAELKTLKDIEWKTGTPNQKCVNSDSLRKEAINHIKSLQYYLDTHSFGTVNQNFTEWHQTMAEGKISWIKHFFNIKDEELK